MTGHILICEWRYWQFRSANGDNDRAFFVFSQQKPAYLLRFVCLSVRMQTVESSCGSLMTFGRVLVSCAALCVCRFHSWLKWEILILYFMWQLSLSFQYTAAHVAISWVGSVNAINDSKGNDSRWFSNNTLTLLNGYCVIFWGYFCTHLKPVIRYIRRTYPLHSACPSYTQLKNNFLQDFRLPTRCGWGPCSSGMLCSVCWYLATFWDNIHPIFKGSPSTLEGFTETSSTKGEGPLVFVT